MHLLVDEQHQISKELKQNYVHIYTAGRTCFDFRHSVHVHVPLPNTNGEKQLNI